MINNLLDADDTDNADLKGCAIKVDKKNPRYPCHPRLKNNIPNGTNHFCYFLSRYEKAPVSLYRNICFLIVGHLFLR